MNSIDLREESRRRLLIQALAGGWFGAAWGWREASAAETFGGRPAKLPPGQSVYRIDGKVLVNGQQASAATRIAAGDTIETPVGGELVYVVGDSAVLQRESSRVALAAGAGGALGGLRLLQGKVLTVFGGGAARELSTPTATVSIKGTGVYLEADPEQTYFCTCYGATDVQAVSDPSSRDSVVSLHHDKPLYILAAGPPGQRIRAAPFVNHTDQELMLIETLVGRTPPFVFPGTQYNTPRPRGRY